MDQELLVLLKDPEALVALYDDQRGTDNLHWLLLDGEVGGGLLRLLLNVGHGERRAGRWSGRQAGLRSRRRYWR